MSAPLDGARRRRRSVRGGGHRGEDDRDRPGEDHREDELVGGDVAGGPVQRHRSGAVIAAVAIVLPSSEWPPEDNVLNDLRETARNISRELGATAWPPQVTAKHQEDDA